ncbi:MAG: hypothetical protein JSR77_07090 [Planctomycetes bacterium]|nr:hypothetical protein [Planctomycetota bacterium]
MKQAHLALALCLASLIGCHNYKHPKSDAAGSTVAVCQKCYDQIAKIRRNRPRTGPTTQVIYKEMCPDCKTELSIYTEGDVLKARCEKCAPQGVACDLCVPKPAGK